MPASTQIPRHAEGWLREALNDSRIVAVEGPRQAGKSTLCTEFAREHGMRVVTLDDQVNRAAANRDPDGFLADMGDRVFIDELQRAPELVLSLKASVDRDPRPGRYLVTGSADLLFGPKIADSLAGRIERIPLRPFTQSELSMLPLPGWLDRLWAGGVPPPTETAAVGRGAYAARIARGGFPAVALGTVRRTRAWLADYAAALATRDVPDLVDVRRPDLFPPLLRHLATRSGSMTAMRPIAQALSVDEKTVRSYVRLLELLHLVVSVPAWTPGAGNRAVKSPRLFIEDSGMLANLLDADSTRITEDESVTGRLYESFVAMELSRLLPFTTASPRVYHWRTQHGDEVDLVLEDRRGRIIAVEIKASASIGRGDLRGIARLRSLIGDRFVAGLVVCTTRQTTPLGGRVWAVPIEALWDEAPDPVADPSD